jgi:carbon-monoxide dehydrogenase medium subunit
MNSTLHEYHRPAEAAEALALLQRAGVSTAPLAVGPRVADGHLAGVEAVIDQAQLGLDYVNETADGVVHLGVTASLQQLVDSVLLQSLADGIVAEAALLAGGSAMRHAATVGGMIAYERQAANKAQRAGPPELLIALLVLEADLIYQRAGQGQVVVTLDAYLSTGGDVALGDLLVEVRFARPGSAAHASLARVARTPRDQAIVAAAALLDGATVRLALAAGGTALRRLTAVEQALSGQALTPERLDEAAYAAAAAVKPRADFRASAEYRRSMAGVLVRRALREAANRAHKVLP